MMNPKERKEHKSSKKSSKKKKDRDRKHKKSRKLHSSSSGSRSENDSDHGAGGSARAQLERERAAVQAARYILAAQPGIRKNFRDLLWELDNGRAAGISGIPDVVLRSQLQYTLEHLSLKCTKGQYWLPSGVPSTLSVIGFVFDEPPASKPPLPLPPQGLVTAAALAPEPAQPAQGGVSQLTEGAGPAVQAVALGPQLPPDVQQQRSTAEEHAASVATGLSSDDGQQQQHRSSESGEPHEPVLPVPRRVVGPAAPSADLLAAAAAYHAEVEAAGGYDAAAGPAADEGAGPIIGPPPPEYVTEANAAPADAREAQVLRVLGLIRAAAAAAAVGQPASSVGPAGPAAAAAGAGAAADPYTVLGVDPTADAATIRKSYWRLSLLIHPDKCSHPAAQEVFQAVSKAAQVLQDQEQRKQVDQHKADAQLRQQALAAAAAAEREVAWRKARGETVPADLAAAQAAAQAVGSGSATRETWMTDLPTNQGKTAAQALAMGLSQASQTAFSRFGVRQPGDTSGWTDTPQQRAMRADGLLTNSSTAARQALPAAAVVESTSVSAELTAAMNEYAAKHRHKTLLEQHAEQQAQESKKKKKEKKQREPDTEKEGKGQKRKGEGGDADDDWSAKHPWRPWDRDRDLEVQLTRPRAAAELLKAAGNLSSRFSGGK